MGRLILASTSTWRRQLLLDAGIRCETAEPDVVESEIVGKTPIETARLRAEAKAKAIERPDVDTIVVGADRPARSLHSLAFCCCAVSCVAKTEKNLPEHVPVRDAKGHSSHSFHQESFPKPPQPTSQ